MFCGSGEASQDSLPETFQTVLSEPVIFNENFWKDIILTLTKLTLGFATLALGIASAASYSLTLTDPAWVGNTQLKPGEY